MNKDQVKLIENILSEFGIDADYLQNNILAMEEDIGEDSLTTIIENVYAKPAKCTEETRSAWELMQRDAQKEGVYLKIISSYRSVQYQAELIKRKLARGQKIEKILKVNALPGWSEHHTGRALDLTSSEEDQVLEESFENTKAFHWLTEHAGKYGFVMSYPRGNSQGYIYEPWHWCYQKNS
ncbi:D-alanyl-D-alanine carboxypeptidase family protein [Francisellaceae bacterium]|nr:D-alanyl-D-alanine carboxypeptidase family protein [Francisellaceae bacterium]